MDRRDFFNKTSLALLLAGSSGSLIGYSSAKAATAPEASKRGSQRHTIKRLKQWEAMRYGMFIHFGMSTFTGIEHADGKVPASTYAPDKLDVEQWISVARDAGMRYAVLTAKHGDGHCLWPSEHTQYSVTNSTNKTDVVEAFVKACEKKGLKPGLYYCSCDGHNLFGSQPRGHSKRIFMPTFPKTQEEPMPPYTSSLYHNFMTAQITELLTNYGPVAEMWVDAPGELGWGYRTFLYNYISELQPDIVIMMNNGVPDSTKYDVAYAWPSDLLAIERGIPPESGYQKWRMIKGKEYYMPGEVCDPIGVHWFYMPNDPPRADQVLLNLLQNCHKRSVNLLLNVPPNKHGLIPDEHVQALLRLRKNASL